MVVRRRRKRIGVSDLPAITQALAPGDVWAIDFQFDSTMAGKPLKFLSIVDEHTREALGGQVRNPHTFLAAPHDYPEAFFAP